MKTLLDLYMLSDEIVQQQHELDEECMSDPNFITCSEAAKMLDVSRQFVMDLIKRGVLFGVAGKTVWVYLPSVNDRLEYIQKHGKPTRGGSRKKGVSKDNIWLKKIYPELFVERTDHEL